MDRGEMYMNDIEETEEEQEAHGPRFAHLSDIATADMQMFPIIYAKIQP